MKKSGFTLIELLVTISIISLLFTIGVAAYQNFNRRQIVDQAASELKENLRLAQSKASAGEKPSTCTGTLNGWRVLISNRSSSYRIQTVCPNVVNFKTVLLPSNVTKTAGPENVLFKVLSQGVEGVGGAGTITISGFDRTSQVFISSTGEIRIVE